MARGLARMRCAPQIHPIHHIGAQGDQPWRSGPFRGFPGLEAGSSFRRPERNARLDPRETPRTWIRPCLIRWRGMQKESLSGPAPQERIYQARTDGRGACARVAQSRLSPRLLGRYGAASPHV